MPERKPRGPDFSNVPQTPMCEEDKDILMVHFLRVPTFYDVAVGRLKVDCAAEAGRADWPAVFLRRVRGVLAGPRVGRRRGRPGHSRAGSGRRRRE